MAEQDVERVQIDTLSDEQRALLEMYLRGAEIPHEMSMHSVTVPDNRAADVYSALSIVVNAGSGVERPRLRRRTDRPIADASSRPAGDHLRSPTERPPLITPRAVVAGGRTVSSRLRRLAGAVIDWAILTAWSVLADRAGAPTWAIVATLGLYIVIATALFGRTLGKLVVGIMVIGHRTGRVPGWLRSTLRWLVVSWFSVVVVVVHGLPVGVEIGAYAVMVATYAPILWDRESRGWHDRAADTVVVRAER